MTHPTAAALLSKPAHGPGLTALVTGASAGLGFEFARLFAADGYNLVLVARNQPALQALAADLTSRHGIRARVIAKDLSDPAAPAQIATELREAGMDVDVLVNNAGFGSQGPFV